MVLDAKNRKTTAEGILRWIFERWKNCGMQRVGYERNLVSQVDQNGGANAMWPFQFDRRSFRYHIAWRATPGVLRRTLLLVIRTAIVDPRGTFLRAVGNTHA